MTTTPVEIRHMEFGRGLFGYKRAAIDEALEQIASSYEKVWSDRGELSDKVETLEAEVARLRETEKLLQETLVAAERAAADTRERARQEAELVLAEAHAEARSVTRAAEAEKERLLGEVRRLRSLLQSALEIAKEAEAPPQKNEQKDEPAVEEEAPAGWPRLEDTAEIRPIPAAERARRSA